MPVWSPHPLFTQMVVCLSQGKLCFSVHWTQKFDLHIPNFSFYANYVPSFAEIIFFRLLFPKERSVCNVHEIERTNLYKLFTDVSVFLENFSYQSKKQSIAFSCVAPVLFIYLRLLCKVYSFKSIYIWLYSIIFIAYVRLYSVKRIFCISNIFSKSLYPLTYCILA